MSEGAVVSETTGEGPTAAFWDRAQAEAQAQGSPQDAARIAELRRRAAVTAVSLPVSETADTAAAASNKAGSKV